MVGPSEFLLEARAACEAGAGEVDRWDDAPARQPRRDGHPLRAVALPGAARGGGRAARGRPRAGPRARRSGRRAAGGRPAAVGRGGRAGGVVGRGPRPARRGGPPPRHAAAPRPSCPPTCPSPGWSSCAATPPAWPARCCARCRAARRRSPAAARPSTPGWSPRSSARRSCSTRSTCRAAPTTRWSSDRDLADAAGGVPPQRVVGTRAARHRGAVRDGGRGPARPRPDGRRLRRRRAASRSSTGRPAAALAAPTRRPPPCSSPRTGWPGTSSAARRWSRCGPRSTTWPTA